MQPRPRTVHRADIVTAFDVTSSMTPYIEGTKATVIAFSKDLEAHNIDARLGLVAYRDLKIGEETEVYGFAASPEQFRSWVAGLVAMGGGDEPESAIDALYSAMAMDFRPNATRIIVLITDASFHEPGQNGRSMQDVTSGLRHQKTIAYVIGPDLPGYRSLADCMGGILFQIRERPDEFRSIIKSLGQSISETVPRMGDLRKAADVAMGRTRAL